MRHIALILLFALALAPARRAAAETPDLRYLLAVLEESLDAGLSRAELHSQRIQIGAVIHLQTLAGTNVLADLASYQRSLAAVDQAWTVLSASSQCQTEKGALRTPADCRALVEPMFQTLGLKAPDLAAAPNPGQVIQDLLKELLRRTDTVLRAVQ